MSLQVRYRLQRGAFRLDAAFEAPGRGVTALFGRSGSGKTLLLRCIAGLEQAEAGFLRLGETQWEDSGTGLRLPPNHRRVGYVFQEAALFPHLSVRGNLHYGLRRTPAEERRIDEAQAVEWLGIGHLLGRRPATLSGGERQRVAIARALLAGPRLLLMDEPLAALDREAKAAILPYLERLHEVLPVPTLYVSHSLDEVVHLADHLVLIGAGRVQGSGPVAELLTRLDLPLAHGEGAAAVVEARVAAHDPEFHLSHLDFPGGRFSVRAVDAPVGARHRLRILAKDVSLALEAPRASSILNVFPARVVAIAEEGPAQRIVQLETGGIRLLSRITAKSASLLGLEPGMALYAQIKSVAVID